MSTNYGRRLRAAREHAQLTQNQLSQKTGIGQSTISTAEREGAGSKETPTYATACGVDVFWLANGTGDMVPSAGMQAPATAATLETVLEGLSLYLVGADDHKRDALAALLSALAREPGDTQTLGAIKMMLESKAFVQSKKRSA